MTELFFLEVEASCEESLRKATRKNQPLQHLLEAKLQQILENPLHFKPLKAPLQNCRRVHIGGSFVLIYEVDLNRKAVRLLRFAHHDEAYQY